MTPAEFAQEIVIRTVEEFRDDRTSRRRAYLAAIAVYHLRDHLAEAVAAAHFTGDPKRDRRAVEIAAESVDTGVQTLLPGDTFDVVRAVANGSKHAVVRGSSVVAFAAGEDWMRPAGRAGTGQAGIFRCGDGFGGREIMHGDARRDLYQAVQAMLSAFLAAFPAELTGCSFDPYPDGC